MKTSPCNLTVLVGLPRTRYGDAPQIAAAFEQMTTNIQRLPGVVSASATGSLPLGGGGGYLGRVFLHEGQPDPPASHDTAAQWTVIQPGFFQTLGVPLIAGRAFTDRDRKESPPVIIVSQAFAREMFGDLLARRNAFGILSEDIHPATGALWGNIPQTYSMAAIINSATRLSVKWEDAWRRA